MKQFIYMDDIILNSLLAQIDRGLVAAIHQKAGVQSKSETRDDFNGKVSAGVSSTNIGVEMKTGATESETQNTEEEQEIIFNDYALTQLVEKMNLVDQEDATEVQDGAIFKYTANFSRVDFSELNALFSSDSLQSLILSTSGEVDVRGMSVGEANKAIQKNKRSTKSNLTDIANILNIGAINFKDSPLFVSDDKMLVAVGKQEKNRLSNAQMSLINGSKIKLTIVGIKRSSLDFSRNANFTFADPTQVLQMSDYFQSMFLKELSIVKDGALLVQPIALYFDVPFETEFD